MNRIGAILLALLSIPFIVLGLIFLIAAATGVPSRLLVGLVLLAIGVAFLIYGIRRLRRLTDISPDVLKTGAVGLARRLGGELTVAQLRAEYRISEDLAQDVMADLVSEGTAVREDREQRAVYVFSGLMPSLAEKTCPYCGTELPVRSALRKCPNCGGTLEITKT
ncbi:MAG: hypothetical protein GX649_12515 [Chloroflexi bacterium]|nr:hypothetical protein [Chloroflexota bacterium]